MKQDNSGVCSKLATREWPLSTFEYRASLCLILFNYRSQSRELIFSFSLLIVNCWIKKINLFGHVEERKLLILKVNMSKLLTFSKFFINYDASLLYTDTFGCVLQNEDIEPWSGIGLIRLSSLSNTFPFLTINHNLLCFGS